MLPIPEVLEETLIQSISRHIDIERFAMESQPHQQKQKKPHHPHHVLPKHESGYTDEAAEECHDLIYRAEEEAHVSRSLQSSFVLLLAQAIAYMRQ